MILRKFAEWILREQLTASAAREVELKRFGEHWFNNYTKQAELRAEVEIKLSKANADYQAEREALLASHEWRAICNSVIAARRTELERALLKDVPPFALKDIEPRLAIELASLVVRQIFTDFLRGRHVRFYKHNDLANDREVAQLRVDTIPGSWQAWAVTKDSPY